MGGWVRQLFRCQISLRNDYAASSSYSSYLFYIFLQKIKVIAKLGLTILWSHCQNSPILTTNGIRKVMQGVDNFNKRILNFCKFISDSASEYRLIHINLFLAAGRVWYHGAWCTGIYFLCFHFPCFWQKWGVREA